MHQVVNFKKGDLVAFDPKHAGFGWVDKVALVLDINDDEFPFKYTLFCEGDILEQVEWWRLMLLSEKKDETSINC